MGLRPFDALALIGIPLAVVGMISEDTHIVWTCFVGCALIVTWAIALHEELSSNVRVVMCFLVMGGFFYAGHIIADRNRENDLSKNQGVLLPASDAEKYNECEFTHYNKFFVHMGTNVFYSDSSKITLMVLDGIDYFSVTLRNGTIFIDSLKIFDDRYDLIAGIHPDGKFWVSPEARTERPDESTLVVYDHTDSKVLSMRFNNPNRLTVNGIFHAKHGVALTATDERLTYGKFALIDGCIAVGDDQVGILPRLFGAPDQ